MTVLTGGHFYFIFLGSCFFHFLFLFLEELLGGVLFHCCKFSTFLVIIIMKVMVVVVVVLFLAVYSYFFYNWNIWFLFSLVIRNKAIL